MTEHEMLERAACVDLAALVQEMTTQLPGGKELARELPTGASNRALGFALVLACGRFGLTKQLQQALEAAPPAPPAWVQSLRDARPMLVAGAHGAMGSRSFSDAAAALDSVDRALAAYAAGLPA